MAGGTSGIAHIMQAIEEGHEILVLPWIGLCWRYLEGHTVGDSGGLGLLPCPLDRFGVVVEAEESRFGIRLGHQDRRSPVTATHVGNLCASSQFGFDPVQSRNPARGEISQIAWPEKTLASFKQAFLMFVPSEAFAGTEDFGEF